MAKYGRKPRPPEERFWAKVRKTETCWLWTGRLIYSGYGHFHIGYRDDGSRWVTMAHRFAYELLVGPITEGLTLDHLCRVRHCVNPAHLEPTTSRENTFRSPVAPAVLNARKTHCINGHPYDQANTYINSHDGSRVCRTCAREASRKYRQANLEACRTRSREYLRQRREQEREG